MCKDFVHQSNVNQEVLQLTPTKFFSLPFLKNLCVCLSVCMCERQTARHTSVVAINLTLASPFEHTRARTHTHYRCLNLSCHPVNVSSPLLSHPTCQSKTVFLFSPLSSSPLVLPPPFSFPLLSFSLPSSFSLFPLTLFSTLLHPHTVSCVFGKDLFPLLHFISYCYSQTNNDSILSFSRCCCKTSEPD